MFLCQKYLLYSTEVLLDIYREYVQQIQGYQLCNDTEISLNVSMRSNRLDFWRFDIKSLSQQYRNKSAISEAQ